MHVSDLVVPGTVNTVPGATLAAFADHGTVPAHPSAVHEHAADASDRQALGGVGIDFSDVTDTLEREGRTKFEDSWRDLGASVEREMHPEAVDTCDDKGSRIGGSESAQLLAIHLNDHYSAGSVPWCGRRRPSSPTGRS
ncbi:transaldolase family protein [Streptomyces vinaceus]|uniref:transaldolase family protein n=1 Tax=Streptomyces vinaceus TaxID=1960 RepID=UPI003686B1E4